MVALIVLGVSVPAGWSARNGTDLSGGALVVVVLSGVAWALGQRDRNRPMRWLPAVRLPGGGTAAGLVAPLSRTEAVWWLLLAAGGTVGLGAVAGRLARPGGWLGLTLGAAAALAALWALHRLWDDLPDLYRIAIVEDGVLARGRLIPWSEIEGVRAVPPADDEDEGGVELRVAGGRAVDLLPAGSMIDPRELRVAVLTYLHAPQRRAELRSPVDPRGATVLPGAGEAPREAVEGGPEP